MPVPRVSSRSGLRSCDVRRPILARLFRRLRSFGSFAYGPVSRTVAGRRRRGVLLVSFVFSSLFTLAVEHHLQIAVQYREYPSRSYLLLI